MSSFFPTGSNIHVLSAMNATRPFDIGTLKSEYSEQLLKISFTQVGSAKIQWSQQLSEDAWPNAEPH